MCNFNKQKQMMDALMNTNIKQSVEQTTFDSVQWEKQELVNDISPEDMLIKFAFKLKN